MLEVEDRRLEEQPTLVMRGKVAVPEIAKFLGMAYGAVETRVVVTGAKIVGSPFARHRALDEKFEEFEVEAGFCLDAAVDGDDHVMAGTLPGGAAAAIWHVGPYDQMRPTYDMLMRWIIEKGCTPAGAAWEIYHSDPAIEPDPMKWRTEVIQPYV